MKDKLLLSRPGYAEFIAGCLACALADIMMIVPACLAWSMTMHISLLVPAGADMTGNSATFYTSTSVICLCLMLGALWFRYSAVYFPACRETGVRRLTIAERLRKIPLSFFMRKDIADVSSSIMNDCGVIERMQAANAAPLVGTMISASMAAFILGIIDWRMMGASLWAVPVSFVIAWMSSPLQVWFKRKERESVLSCEDGVQDFLECTKDLRANNYSSEYAHDLADRFRKSGRKSVSSEMVCEIFMGIARFVLRLGLISCAIVGAMLCSEGSLKASIYLLFLFVSAAMYWRLESALNNFGAMIAGSSSSSRLNELMSLPVQGGRTSLKNTGCRIVFDHVNFSYGDEPVIHDVSFTAEQGQVTAIVGPSGAGKSTIARLAVRFWDIQSGKITLGGMNIADADPEALMSLVSMVFQDVVLFDGTVLENIRIGRRNASEAEVREAAEMAHCEEFVRKLPQGWKTRIGENGWELSGGERQRISIARALLKNAPVILLDEATASLDAENENLLQSALSNLIRHRTVIVIAHRMRTVMGADKIIVVDGGRIVEEGSPQELLKRRGIFAHMAELQGMKS